MEEAWKPSIGSTVRARLAHHKKRKHRAIVADDDNGKYLLLWEDVFQFSVLQESLCSLQDMEPLLDFEASTILSEGDFAENKARGDQLLALGDAAVALGYYERALRLIQLQIGCTIVLKEAESSKKASSLKLAEVDCVEADGVDVTILPRGLEKTIVADQVALVIFEPDQESLQVRMLLNCARCCLQLAELSTSIKSHFTQRAVHFCSLCMLILEFRQDESSSYLQTALLLRSQALAEKHQYDAALSDLSKLLKLNPDHDVGIRKVKQYKRQKEETKQKEKKLVKAMCGYIQQATNGVSTTEESPTSSKEPSEITATRVDPTNQVSRWIPFLIIALLAWLLQKSL